MRINLEKILLGKKFTEVEQNPAIEEARNILKRSDDLEIEILERMGFTIQTPVKPTPHAPERNTNHHQRAENGRAHRHSHSQVPAGTRTRDMGGPKRRTQTIHAGHPGPVPLRPSNVARLGKLDRRGRQQRHLCLRKCNGFCGWLPNPQDLFEIIGTATHNPDWRNSLRGREFNNVDKQINEMTQTIKQPENEEPKSQPGAVSGSALLRELAPAAS